MFSLFKRDKRRFPRVSDILRINYQLGDDNLHFNCSSRDISEGGIRLNLFENIKIGTSIKLGIYLEDAAPPRWTIARVVWTKVSPGRDYPYEAGVEFSGPDSIFRTSIRDHIESLVNKRS